MCEGGPFPEYSPAFIGPAVTETPYHRADKPASVGKLLRNLEARFVDDDGNDVPPGEPGEFWVRYAVYWVLCLLAFILTSTWLQRTDGHEVSTVVALTDFFFFLIYHLSVQRIRE